MKTTVSLLRIALVTAVALFLIDYFLAGEKNLLEALFAEPVLLLALLTLVIFAAGMEVIVASVRSLLYQTLSEEAKKKYDAREEEKKQRLNKWLDKFYKTFVEDDKPLEEEKEILLDHNYDGIRELDNKLPPWWVNLFWATIIFGSAYMFWFHVFGGMSQEEEYQQEVAEAAEAIQEYRRTAKGLVDASTVVILTEKEDLEAGRSIFENSCAACHRADGGGGIGPNLTDNYWILGGTIKDVYGVISEGGRPGKGMIAWKNELKPLQIAQVASYVLSLQGTHPADAKPPEGELFEDPLPTGETQNPDVNTEKTDVEELID